MRQIAALAFDADGTPRLATDFGTNGFLDLSFAGAVELALSNALRAREYVLVQDDGEYGCIVSSHNLERQRVFMKAVSGYTLDRRHPPAAATLGNGRTVIVLPALRMSQIVVLDASIETGESVWTINERYPNYAPLLLPLSASEVLLCGGLRWTDDAPSDACYKVSTTLPSDAAYVDVSHAYRLPFAYGDAAQIAVPDGSLDRYVWGGYALDDAGAKSRDSRKFVYVGNSRLVSPTRTADGGLAMTNANTLTSGAATTGAEPTGTTGTLGAPTAATATPRNAQTANSANSASAANPDNSASAGTDEQNTVLVYFSPAQSADDDDANDGFPVALVVAIVVAIVLVAGVSAAVFIVRTRRKKSVGVAHSGAEIGMAPQSDDAAYSNPAMPAPAQLYNGFEAHDTLDSYAKPGAPERLYGVVSPETSNYGNGPDPHTPQTNF